MKEEFNWNLTKCRAKYKGHAKANYTFYIVDYVYGEWPKEDFNIVTLRNKGLVKTQFFYIEARAKMCINLEGGRITMAQFQDRLYTSTWKRCKDKFLNMIFDKKEVIK